MQNRKPPAYQEYPATILASLPFRKMSLQERGLFCTLRYECRENIRLPATHNELAKVLGLPVDEVVESLGAVMPLFDLQDGFIICPELEDYRTHLADRKKKQNQGGKIGSAMTNRKLHTKNKNITSNSRLPCQGTNESLVLFNTVKPSQTKPSQAKQPSL